jgi:hypothetical protein
MVMNTGIERRIPPPNELGGTLHRDSVDKLVENRKEMEERFSYNKAV